MDDHYCCKICGQINCVCPPQVPPARMRPAPKVLGEILQEALQEARQFQPYSFIRDFNEASVTWKFNTNEEADRFANAVASLLKGN